MSVGMGGSVFMAVEGIEVEENPVDRGKSQTTCLSVLFRDGYHRWSAVSRYIADMLASLAASSINIVAKGRLVLFRR